MLRTGHGASRRAMSTGTLMHEMQWMVSQIKFAEWTLEGPLRHSKFLGLRI